MANRIQYHHAFKIWITNSNGCKRTLMNLMALSFKWAKNILLHFSYHLDHEIAFSILMVSFYRKFLFWPNTKRKRLQIWKSLRECLCRDFFFTVSWCFLFNVHVHCVYTLLAHFCAFQLQFYNVWWPRGHPHFYTLICIYLFIPQILLFAKQSFLSITYRYC